MNKRQHILLLILSLFIYSIWAKIPNIKVNQNYVIWFDILYLISSYIRIYNLFEKLDYKRWGWLTMCSIILSILSVITIVHIGKFPSPYYFVADSNAILAVIVSVCAFMWFKSYPLKYHKWINSIGATTFGVLLIHANSNTMRQWLWKDTLNNAGMYNEGGAIYIHSIASVLGIFIICTIIDQLRLKYLEKPLFKVLDNYMAKRNNKFIFEWT